jgi:carbon-monoxide dehydrogenase large subunit
MGNALRRAAQDARQQLLEIASKFLAVDIADLQVEEGIIYAKSNPSLRKRFAEVIKNQFGGGLDIIGRGSYYSEIEGHTGGMWATTDPSLSEKWSSPSIWMFGSDAAEVDVDVGTGKVKVQKLAGAYNVGKVINPLTCEGQIEGGLVHGMGHALFEEMIIGKKGELLNPSFADYKIPTSLDTLEIIPLTVEKAQSEGPWGAKGIGEMTLVSSPAAIANAIYDATGIRIKDLPVTPEKMFWALKEKRTAKK